MKGRTLSGLVFLLGQFESLDIGSIVILSRSCCGVGILDLATSAHLSRLDNTYQTAVMLP